MLAAVLTLAIVSAVGGTQGRDTLAAKGGACGSRTPSSPEAFVVMMPAKPAPRDTLVRAIVCVLRGSAGRLIGSYHGELQFDSTAARVLSVVKPGDGMRVENTTRAGSVRFAGAAPSGFTEANLITVLLRLRTTGKAPKLRLAMIELNATDGSNLMKQLVNSSAPRP